MLPSFCVTIADKKQSKSVQALAGLVHTLGSSWEGAIAQPTLGVKIEKRDGGLQQALWSAPGYTYKAASRLPVWVSACLQAGVPGIPPLASFSGQEGSHPCLGCLPLPPPSTTVPLCRKSGPSGSPSDRLPEAHTGAGDLPEKPVKF